MDELTYSSLGPHHWPGKAGLDRFGPNISTFLLALLVTSIEMKNRKNQSVPLVLYGRGFILMLLYGKQYYINTLIKTGSEEI
jgi:hypothetical protein